MIEILYKITSVTFTEAQLNAVKKELKPLTDYLETEFLKDEFLQSEEMVIKVKLKIQEILEPIIKEAEHASNLDHAAEAKHHDQVTAKDKFIDGVLAVKFIEFLQALNTMNDMPTSQVSKIKNTHASSHDMIGISRLRSEVSKYSTLFGIQS